MFPGLGPGTSTWGLHPRSDDLALVVVVVLATAALLVALQWRRFSRGLGAFRCFVRLPGSEGPFSRWRRGAARFDTDSLRWFPAYTLLASRSLVLGRGELELFGRWAAGGDDGVPQGLTVLRGSVRGRTVELAVPSTSAAALVLWVESGPPGRGVNVA
jgi:hypothetical protein